GSCRIRARIAPDRVRAGPAERRWAGVLRKGVPRCIFPGLTPYRSPCMRWLILPLVLVVAGAGAMYLRSSASAGPEAAAAEPLQLTVTARDLGLELPESVPAGVTT